MSAIAGPLWLTGIDHPVIAAGDMAAARGTYERLGFTIPPRGSHVEWGTGNWCIMFPQDYLEIRGVVREGQTHNLDQFIDRYGQGLMGLALGTQQAEASRAALLERGFHPSEVRPLARNFELPEGWVQPRFSLCFLDGTETGGLASVVFCQHLTPDLLRRPEWLAHANGAVGVREVVGVVEDLDGAASVQRRLFGGKSITRQPEELAIDAGRGRIRLLTRSAAAGRWPEVKGMRGLDESRLIGVAIETNSLEGARGILDANRITYRTSEAGSLVVSPEFALGTVLEFVPRS